MFLLPQLNALALDWLVKMVNVTLTGSLVLVVILVLNGLMKHGSAEIKFMLLFSALCSLVLLPLIPKLSGRMANQAAIHLSSPVLAGVTFSDETMAAEDSPFLAPVPHPKIRSDRGQASVLGKLLLFWLGGVLVVGCYILIGLIGMYRFIFRVKQQGKQATAGDWGLPAWNAADQPYQLPVTCGLFRPFVVLPENFASWPQEHQAAVLWHEAAHLRRRDNLTNLVARLITVIYWYNPLVWLALFQLRITRESACDDYVLSNGTKPSAYAGMILNALRSNCRAKPSSLMLNFNSKGEKRMKYILDSKVNHQAVSFKTRVVILVGLGLALIPLAGLQLLAADQAAALPLNSLNAAPDQPGPTEPARQSASTNPSADHIASIKQTTGEPVPQGLPVSQQDARPVTGEAIEQLAAPSRLLEAEIMAFQSKQQSVLGTGQYILPVNGKISMPFGYRIHPILQKKNLHGGIDLTAPRGTSIWAVDDGVVIASGLKGGYGKTVVVDHGGYLSTVYAHASEVLVVTGQRVTKGDIIALVGSTGMSTGPHLHFEVRKAGVVQNPVKYIPKLSELPAVFDTTSTEASETGQPRISITGNQVKVDFSAKGTVTTIAGQINETPLGWPIRGEILFPYGFQLNPASQKEYFHQGVDLGCQLQTPVLATADGYVTQAGMRSDGAGNTVIIHHGKWRTLYAKLHEIKVRVGQPVKQGEVIGYSGVTGNNTGIGPHLHYGIFSAGEGSIDPVPFLGAGGN